jgi:hypothetical protein
MFVAGDSVLQGYGAPSAIEFLNEVLPIVVWNLSSTRYGPRQKANALITYALPRRPKWIILEFYSDNDINDAISDEICDDSGNFHCLFNASEKRKRLLMHPMYSSMVDMSKDGRGMFEDYAENSFTLAVTRNLVEKVKVIVRLIMTKLRIDSEIQGSKDGPTQEGHFSFSDVSHPGDSDFTLYNERRFDWLRQGMHLTYKRYDRLVTEIGNMAAPRPVVILLYNPSAYEIYRDVNVERNREIDRVSAFQRQAVRDYAAQKGWKFLDLTQSLHNEVAKSGFWIYGKNDRTHWSTQGAPVVASVLARELEQVIGRGERGQ